MIWFFIALTGPFLYALTNHIDKLLLEKYFKDGGIGTLLLFSSLLSIFALPFFFFIDPTVLDVSGIKILVLSIVGILNVLVLFFYFIALEREEASIAVVFYQLVPVFGGILGYLILGEILSKTEIIAMLVIILGTTIVSFEVDSDNKFKLRQKTVLPMLGASFCWALGSVLFKAVAIEENLWRSLFWESLMLVVIGFTIFIFHSKNRKRFISVIKKNSKRIIFLNFLNEFLYIVGNIAFSYAYLLAPIGLVLITESFQPIFVLIIAIFLTLFFPKISVEKIQMKHLWPKIAAICITGIGTYLLFTA